MPQWRNASDHAWGTVVIPDQVFSGGLWRVNVQFSRQEHHIILFPTKYNRFLSGAPRISTPRKVRHLIFLHFFILFILCRWEHDQAHSNSTCPDSSAFHSFYRGFDERRSEESPARRRSQHWPSGPHPSHRNGPVGPRGF